MAKFRLGKNEKWILAECFKRYPEPLRKYEVLEGYYKLERSHKRAYIGYDGPYFKEYGRHVENVGYPNSQRRKRNNAVVSYAKSIKTLEIIRLITVFPFRPNLDCIYLTDFGLKIAVSINFKVKE